MLNSRPWLLAVSVCVACGSTFAAADKGAPGGASGAGEAGSVSTNGGATSDAGDAGTGAVSPAGGRASAGSGAGGTSAGSGGSAGGSAGSSVGAGGARAGAGGSAGGAGSGGGSGGGADCAKLKNDYLATLEQARVCDKGSTEQCNVNSTLPGSCNCPVFVNAKSEYTTLAKKQQQAMTDAGCHYAVCGIACLLSTSASCAQQQMASGNTYLCTGTTALQ